MNSLSSLLLSKTALAIGIYLLACISLLFCADAQIRSMQLLQAGQPMLQR